MTKPLFLSFEGIDGCGKSTQIDRLAFFLRQQRVPHVLTREPGGTKVGDHLRALLLDPGADLQDITELLLIEASRCQLVQQVVRPALTAGKWVICDRFTDATLAYQHYGRKLPLAVCQSLNDLVTHNLYPDMTFLLDITPNISRERTAPQKRDRFERMDSGFFARVRQGYLALARLYPRRIHVLDGSAPQEDVFARIHHLLALHLEART